MNTPAVDRWTRHERGIAMKALRSLVLPAVFVLVSTLASRPATANEYYCCAFCQGGNSTQTICTIGSCMFYESQKCSYYTKGDRTYCRQTIDIILCPRPVFSPNPWKTLATAEPPARESPAATESATE